MLESVWSSFLLVVFSEMGDKTQLLALMLAARFRKPWPIFAGITVATLANHGLAAWAGVAVAGLINPEMLRWGLAIAFIGFGIWILFPDKDDDGETKSGSSVFWITTVTFFFAEMGDKTQLATVALGARFQDVGLVTLGTTLGMLVAIVMGERVLKIVPMKWMRLITAVIFWIFAILILLAPTARVISE
jgi:putative Ca2+/H+ antiporter (TMEM165/GDT1 family)